MIVVTDTSVVLNLCCLGLEWLLQEMFGEVIAPPSVAGEFRKLAGIDNRFFGILGILIQAKHAGLLSAIEPVVNELESKAGFWIASSLRHRVLDLVDE